MKFATLLFLLPAVLALPTEQAQDSNSIDPNRKFRCPDKVQGFCSASNIKSGCSSDGKFHSEAMDTCGDCACD
ncbi:hypothetical protein N5P37_010012 [Trichoderma harzianum]|uniref:Uncharacterized protein n=1 Tax=Trichoderma harzianum CBS 226.95 TaxID=983964 RepID=A0A2T4A5H3_TRIHA|nr:hypothetical protein M431DRAFT_7726 [Trichoderma harzianum CBS 226.95]KAK0757293.1 hypothetical protein N5P37_010012 [Trichoderma harzianum]PKK49980.1 hypothetical protein CI102_6871 [Trichoderma harzianum]PTB52296.1 hypothetical protein M431DRAFT_7726 [Trichoderma harzianum CBS 226.95]